METEQNQNVSQCFKMYRNVSQCINGHNNQISRKRVEALVFECPLSLFYQPNFGNFKICPTYM